MQDSRNASANMGRRPEPASLDFSFDNKPGAGKKAEEQRRTVHREVKPAQPEAKADLPKEEKHYGLPEDYRLTSEVPAVKPEEPETDAMAQINAAISAKMSSAGKFIKKKYAEGKEAAKNARAAAADKTAQMEKEKAAEAAKTA